MDEGPGHVSIPQDPGEIGTLAKRGPIDCQQVHCLYGLCFTLQLVFPPSKTDYDLEVEDKQILSSCKMLLVGMYITATVKNLGQGGN